jgi:membrane fusion protein (multidrug efflux system)
MKTAFRQASLQRQAVLLIALIGLISQYGCSPSAGNSNIGQPPPPALPVLAVNTVTATTFQEFPSTVEGTVNVEIRPQVDGYLDKIYVDEGAYVTKGQPLFKINDNSYSEQVNNAKANIEAAKANVEKAAIELNRIKPLVQNKVISEVQLKSAQAAYDAAKAQLAQAQAGANNAGINLGYTLIKAPVSGYIGRIPFKTGSLVGRNETQPLTVLSDIRNVYAYFSMSEADFLQFTALSKGTTINDKIRELPPVELQLADNSIYPAKGKIELVEGQFDKTMGTISFRAVFPNPNGLLRSGNTGKIRIPHTNAGVLAVPQQSTFELQDKVFVFALGDSNKVVSKPIVVGGKTTNYYLVNTGLKPGEKIVFTGVDRLHDGTVIQPQALPTDSVLRSMPL